MKRTILVVATLCVGILAAGCHRKPVNVLLVTFDTVRWDHVGYATGRENFTPMLDELARRGTWFSQCITPQPLTLPSHSSIMTGLYPFHHGVRNNGTYILGKDNVTLAERFHDAGYATHAVISAFVLDSRFGLDQGFDSYDDDLSGGPRQKMFMFKEVKAGQTAQRAVRWLEKERPKDRPFFLWVHFFDPHADYEPPAEWAARFPGDPYRGEIAYADHNLGRILKMLDDGGLLEHTVVAFTADHGDGLGEHGEQTHSLFIYDSTVHVPLLLSGPGVPEGRRVDDLVRTIDIAPTLLRLAHLKAPGTLDGKPLQPLWKGRSDHRVAYLETFVPRFNFGWSELRGMRDSDTKVILAPKPEAYDLTADSGELNNLASGGSMPADGAALMAALRKIVKEDPFTHGEQQAGQVDQETRRKLAALGYISGPSPPAEGKLPDPKDRIESWQRFQHTQSLIRADRYEEAEREAEALLREDPNNVVAMGSLAAIFVQLDKPEKALATYRRMLQLDPRRDAAYLGAARVLGKLDRYEEAVAMVRKLLAQQPQSVEAYTVLGDLALDRDDYSEAEKAFRKALEIDPHSSLAASGLGNCLNRSGRLQEARDLLAEFHTKDPTSHAVTYNLAVVSDRLGDQRAALALYQQAVRLAPDHSMSWNNLGSILSKMGRRQEALRCVAKAHDLDPDNVEATYNLGALLAQAGQPEKALPLLEEALAARPDLVQAALMRLRVLEQLGRTREALAGWRRMGSDNPAALLQVARLEAKLGDRKGARKTLKKALTLGGARARQAAERNPTLRSLLD